MCGNFEADIHACHQSSFNEHESSSVQRCCKTKACLVAAILLPILWKSACTSVSHTCQNLVQLYCNPSGLGSKGHDCAGSQYLSLYQFGQQPQSLPAQLLAAPSSLAAALEHCVTERCWGLSPKLAQSSSMPLATCTRKQGYKIQKQCTTAAREDI